MALPSINIASCFENIINLRGICENEESTSGYYANDIDITKDFIDQIRTSEFASSLDFHNRKLAFAIKQVVDQALSFMQPNFRTNTLIDNYRVGQFQDDLAIIAGDGYLKGINIDLQNGNSYLNMFVQEIAMQLTVTGTVNVLVYDLIQSKLLDTLPVACVANEICRIYPAKTYKSERQKLNLLFAYDSTGISANTTYLKNGSSNCASCNNGMNNPFENISAVKIDPGASKIKSNLKPLGETGGMSIVHSLSCNHESWLCSFSNLLAQSILYRYGILVMEFAKNTSPNDRINTTVNINSEEIDSRIRLYQSRYNESMGNALTNMKTPSDAECFMCRQTINHKILVG